MHFSLATFIAIIPLLASASPLAEQPHATIPLSKRSNLFQSDGSVNVEQLRGHLASTTAKIARGFDNYERNTGRRHPMQPKVVSAGSKRGVGEEPLIQMKEEDYKELWQGTISVGTPPKVFTVEYDTSTSDLFLPGPSCGASCSGHTVYNPSHSTTSMELNEGFSMLFAGGNYVIGNEYNDTVRIAGLTATSQTLGAAENYTTGFQRRKFSADGIMGMAFQDISNYNASPVFQTLVRQGQTTKGVFAFKLASSGSELTIGGLNSALYSGTPTYTPVTEKSWWKFEFSALKVGGTAIVDEPTAAIVNSGSAFITGSPSGVKALYAKIRGSKDATSTVGRGFYTFPCSATIPPISFTIGGKDLHMSSSTLIVGPLKHDSSTCVGSIVADKSIASAFWMFGDSWMRNYYTILDDENSRVGFADFK